MLQAVERERISTTILVPTMIQMMVDHAEAPKHDLSSLRSAPVRAARPSTRRCWIVARSLLAADGPPPDLRHDRARASLRPILPGIFPHRRRARARGKIRSAGHSCLGVEGCASSTPRGRRSGRAARWGEIGRASAPRSCWGTGTRLMKTATGPAAGTPTRAGCTTGDGGPHGRGKAFVYVVDRVKEYDHQRRRERLFRSKWNRPWPSNLAVAAWRGDRACRIPEWGRSGFMQWSY